MSLLLDLIITVISVIIIGICVQKIINCYDEKDEKDKNDENEK